MVVGESDNHIDTNTAEELQDKTTVEQDDSVEFDAVREYEAVLGAVRELFKASEIDTDSALEAMASYAEAWNFIKLNKDGHLAVNSYYGSFKPGDLEERGEIYQRRVDIITEFGHLEPAARESFSKAFSINTFERRYNWGIAPEIIGVDMEHAGPTVRMSLDSDGTFTTHDAFVAIIEHLDLGEDISEEALGYLRRVASRKKMVEEHPEQGSNFLYRYSKPFLEIGRSNDGEAFARVGAVLRHEISDGVKYSFEGVEVPFKPAVETIGSGLQIYIDQAEPEKEVAPKAPKAEELVMEAKEEQEARLNAFIKQTRVFAPELSGLTDEELKNIATAAAKNEGMIGRGGDRFTGTQLELYAFHLLRSPNAVITYVCDENNVLHDSRPAFFNPVSIMRVNGATGLATREDYSHDPRHIAAHKPYLGEETLSPEDSAAMRQRIFEKIMTHSPEDFKVRVATVGDKYF